MCVGVFLYCFDDVDFVVFEVFWRWCGVVDGFEVYFLVEDGIFFV